MDINTLKMGFSNLLTAPLTSIETLYNTLLDEDKEERKNGVEKKLNWEKFIKIINLSNFQI